MRRENRIYLAGFFDGEGSISLTRRNRKDRSNISLQPQILLANTNKEIMDWVYLSLKEETIRSMNYRQMKKRKPQHKDCFQLCIKGQISVKKFLALVYPYLRIKRPQADIVFKFISLREKKIQQSRKEKFPFRIKAISTEEFSLVGDIRKLNRRGIFN